MKTVPEKRFYIYPKLPAIKNLGFIRLGGSGLANCMFVAARACVLSHETGYLLIDPTWARFSLGPFIRRERDKRNYIGLFKKTGISGLSKLFLLLRIPRIKPGLAVQADCGIIVVEGLDNYFADLLNNQKLVKDYFSANIHSKVLEKVKNVDFSNVIGVHIRLGDYIQSIRTDIAWYGSLINQLIAITKGAYRIFIFSDGSDEELKSIITLNNCERTFFGNALADIIALSKCRLIIGSDSTFSGWGAFLGQVPIIFPRRHFPPVLLKNSQELVLNNSTDLPNEYMNSISLSLSLNLQEKFK